MCHMQIGGPIVHRQSFGAFPFPKSTLGKEAQGRRGIFHTKAQSHRASASVTHTCGGNWLSNHNNNHHPFNVSTAATNWES